MATPLSLSWTLDGQGGSKADPEWLDVDRSLEALRDSSSGTVALTVVSDESGEAETLCAETSPGTLYLGHGRYRVTLNESDDRCKVGGGAWVIATIDVVAEMFGEFFATGTLPMEWFY